MTRPKFQWRVHNPDGQRRVIVTKELPGQRWLEFLTEADCRVEICTSSAVLPTKAIAATIARAGCRLYSWGSF